MKNDQVPDAEDLIGFKFVPVELSDDEKKFLRYRQVVISDLLRKKVEDSNASLYLNSIQAEPVSLTLKQIQDAQKQFWVNSIAPRLQAIRRSRK